MTDANPVPLEEELVSLEVKITKKCLDNLTSYFQADPQEIAGYMARLTAFVVHATKNGFTPAIGQIVNINLCGEPVPIMLAVREIVVPSPLRKQREINGSVKPGHPPSSGPVLG